ncbi:hypothetical protein [Streptomyces ficellus]|uniref:hypothetical protein n=1 Tax=Streptomyces ficellus TaxID=1977088 RepID=UPI0012E7373B|nr:hypothetical protein [Streptomyces ficellus]
MTVIRTPALNTGLDDFLSRADEEREARGEAPLPPRAADAVLTLLALRGAERRTGVPEPTARLLGPVLHEDLPALLWAGPEETDAVPEVLVALADRARAAGRLNTKRHARLLAAIEDALPEFRRAMADPWNLTWPRWYASLLRADGADADDPAAVRAWLAAHEDTPHAERPALPAPLHRSDVAARTFTARAQLGETLLAAFARDVEEPSPAGPLLPGGPLGADRPDEALPAELERIAAALSDRWTADGLAAALAGPDGPHAGLAPGPESIPHFALADRLLGEHLDYYGDSRRPLPPPPAPPAPEEIGALLHAAPLPAALAAGSDDVPHELAERCFDGAAATVWTDGTPEELTELAADILAAVVEDIGSTSDSEYAQDAAHLLYALYERGGTADSVVRKAAENGDLPVDPELEDAPVEVPERGPDRPAHEPYEMPPRDLLPALLGVPDPGDEELAGIEEHARALADVVDRLAATGCVYRVDDAYGLTPLGSAVLRHVLSAGHVAVPDAEEVSEWEAAEVVAAVRSWPERTAADTLGRWTAGRGLTAWSALLDAAEAAGAGTGAGADDRAARDRGGDDRRGERDQDRDGDHGAAGVDTAAVFARFALAAVPAEALRAALARPVTGAHAHRLLVSRGEAGPADAERVPLGARAALTLETLAEYGRRDLRTHARAAGRSGGEPDRDTPPRALPAAFDAAAAAWPGGAPALVEALVRADSPASRGGTALRVLEGVAAHHPDPTVASLAAHAAGPLRQGRPLPKTP